MDSHVDDRTGDYSLPELQSGEGSSQLSSGWSVRDSPVSMGPDTPLNLYSSFLDPVNPAYPQFEYTSLWDPHIQQRNPHTTHDDLCIDKCTGIYTNPAQTLMNFELDDPWTMPRLRAASGSVSLPNGHIMANSTGGILGNSPTQPPQSTQATVTNPLTRRPPNNRQYQLMINPTFQSGQVPIRANLGASNSVGGVNANTNFSVQPSISSTPFGTGDLGGFSKGRNEDGSVYSSLCLESQCCYSSRDCLEDHCDGDDCQGDDCYDEDCHENDCHEQTCQEDNCQPGNCPYVCTNCFPQSPFGGNTPTETLAPAAQGSISLDFSGQDPCPLPHDQPSNHTRIEHNVAHTLQVLSAQGTLDARDQTTHTTGWKPSGVGGETTYACLWICNPDAPPAERRVCGEKFGDAEQLDKHVCRAHTSKLNSRTKYMCLWDGCIRKEDQYFTSRAKLDRHIPTHTGYKPMTCQICGMSLSSQQALEQHQRTHTREKPYVCDKCGKAFTTKSSLITHKRIHDGSKPLRCDVCGKEFGDSSNLSKHKATHQGKTRHCPFPGCGKSFRRNDQLERHQKVHQTGLLPCTFPGCGQSFRRKRQLEEHQKTHSAERQYSAGSETPIAHSIPQETQLVEQPSILFGDNIMYQGIPLLRFQQGHGKEPGSMWHDYESDQTYA